MILAGCTIGVTSCKTETKNSETNGYSLATITADTDKEITTSYSASIEGKQDIDIYPQVSGYIEKLNVSEGDIVRKGEILFVIDQVPYKAALETAIANVESAKANLATAELTYKSTQALFAKKVVSDFNLQTTKMLISQPKHSWRRQRLRKLMHAITFLIQKLKVQATV